MKSYAFLAVLVISGTLGCLNREPTRPETLPVERLTPDYRGTYSGLMDAARLVVRDRDRFAEIWRDAYGPSTPVPDLDFTRDVAIVVAMGEQRSGGYSIAVERVTPVKGRIIVDVTIALPGSGAVPAVMTQPNDIVKVPARSGTIEFRERTVVRS